MSSVNIFVKEFLNPKNPKTLADLYETMEAFGPLARSYDKTGTVLPDTAQVKEDNKEVLVFAMNLAVRMTTPDITEPLPQVGDDPYLGWVKLKEWCKRNARTTIEPPAAIKKEIIGKILKIIGAIVAFFAALLTILHLLGWIEPTKEFIAKILWPK